MGAAILMLVATAAIVHDRRIATTDGGRWNDGAIVADPLRLELNEADEAALVVLPGIGPALATRIVQERARAGPYRDLDDLARVRGIGPRTIDRLRPHLAVDMARRAETDGGVGAVSGGS